MSPSGRERGRLGTRPVARVGEGGRAWLYHMPNSAFWRRRCRGSASSRATVLARLGICVLLSHGFESGLHCVTEFLRDLLIGDAVEEVVVRILELLAHLSHVPEVKREGQHPPSAEAKLASG